jgi:hypothetical protein
MAKTEMKPVKPTNQNQTNACNQGTKVQLPPNSRTVQLGPIILDILLDLLQKGIHATTLAYQLHQETAHLTSFFPRPAPAGRDACMSH